MIKSKEKDEIWNKLFDFTIIERVGTELTVNKVNVSFENAVKRFSNNIHISHLMKIILLLQCILLVQMDNLN